MSPDGSLVVPGGTWNPQGHPDERGEAWGNWNPALMNTTNYTDEEYWLEQFIRYSFFESQASVMSK